MIENRTYSIDELFSLTGFSQRNIAYYIQQGLLPKIGRRGRNTRYPQLFVDRLRFIQRVRDLQDSGRLGSVTLPRIARVIWYLVEQSGDAGDLPDLDDRELQRLFEGDSIPDERVLGGNRRRGTRRCELWKVRSGSSGRARDSVHRCRGVQFDHPCRSAKAD